MSATASSSISATVTITIGSKTVTLDSSDLGSLQKPQVFNLPEGGINFTTQEVIDWVNATFGTSLAVPTSITDLVQANISMEDLYMTSVKDFRTDVSLTFQLGKSFSIFPGLSVDSLGLKMKYEPASSIAGVDPAEAAPGANIIIGGTGLANPISVTIGDSAATIVKSTDNNFLTVTVPAGLTDGVAAISVTDSDGAEITNDATESKSKELKFQCTITVNLKAEIKHPTAL